METLNYYNMNPHNLKKDQMMKNINFGSRDNSRRPMNWNCSENGGFGGGKTWLPVHNKYQEINVENDLKSNKSVYRYFQNLFKLRAEHKAFTIGGYEDMTDDRNGIYIYKRFLDDECYIIVCNFEKETNLTLHFDGELVLSNYGERETSGKYLPYECAVYRVK